jgi:GNAT superfamily N-acetyltransferase
MVRMTPGEPDTQPRVREIAAGETATAYSAMRELRPHVVDAQEFVTRVDQIQRPQGYRLVGVFLAERNDAVAAAGFRTGDNLAGGRFLYVDDLVTVADHRGKGYARTLMRWLIAEAQQMGCDVFELDSATHRHAAHRLYLTSGLDITAFHFTLNLLARDAD